MILKKNKKRNPINKQPLPKINPTPQTNQQKTNKKKGQQKNPCGCGMFISCLWLIFPRLPQGEGKFSHHTAARQSLLMFLNYSDKRLWKMSLW